MNEDWTKDIQRLMADRQVKAPDGLLEEVKKQLASAAPVAPSKPVQPVRKVAMWRYRWLAAAAVVAVVAVPVTWLMLKVDDSPHVVAVSRAVHQSAGRAEARSALHADNKPALGAFAAGQEIAMLSKHDQVPSRGQLTDETQGAPDGNKQTIGEAKEEPLGQTAPAASNDEKGRSASELPVKNKPKNPKDRNTNQYQPEADYTRHRSASTSSPLTVTACYCGAFSGNGLAADICSDMASGYYSDEMPFGTFPVELGKANLLMVKQPERKAHHAQPIKVGVSVGYRLSSRWAVNTGVTYSYLSSNFTENDNVVEHQKLHYVGVPFTASYSFLRTRHAEVYVTAGGEVEKLVKGSGGIDGFDQEKLTEKRPQWSLKAAVGGAYRFTPSLSLYAEPGLTHYFDNHSSIDNVYKDKPTSFSLNVGLRFNVK